MSRAADILIVLIYLPRLSVHEGPVDYIPVNSNSLNLLLLFYIEKAAFNDKILKINM